MKGPAEDFPAPRAEFSALEKERIGFTPRLPDVLKGEFDVKLGESEGAAGDIETIKKLFPNSYGIPIVEFTPASKKEAAKPLRVAAVLSGGQAPGGHSVITGLYDYVKRHHPDSTMIGYCNGPHGVFSGNYINLDDDIIDRYRNMGGFDIIGSGRHKIEKEEDFASSLKFATEFDLDGLVVIGGDDSNTNAAVLAEYFAKHGAKTVVNGAPKTIDGDLKVHPHIPISFGFDTACKTYAEMVGNVASDAISSQKYYHFVRLMGRSASHITLEVAFQTQPNYAFIGEEVKAKNMSLAEVTNELVKLVVSRSKAGKNFGVVLVPEGLIEFIPEVGALIEEINEILSKPGVQANAASVSKLLTPAAANVFGYLPDDIKQQLLLDRDAHGNVAVSKIETERLLCSTLEAELKKLKSAGKYDGAFSPQFHFFGYEGRSGLPSQFDSNYCYSLGYTAGALIGKGKNGYIASITGLDKPVEQWSAGGCPTTMLMNVERRIGHDKPVIKKALTELDGEPFKQFCEKREEWAEGDEYRNPGPIQFEGPGCDAITYTLQYEIDGLNGEPKKKKARK